MSLSEIEKEELQKAKNLLENPGLAVRITNLIGRPVEKCFDSLPEHWHESIAEVTQTTLLTASSAVGFTMKDVPNQKASNSWHKWGAFVCGGVGGCLGFAGVSIELSVSTTIMLRSIMDVARSEGESIASPETKKACLEVFAFGGRSEADDSAESSYYTIRYTLARSVQEASEHVIQKGLTRESAPALITFITKIAERFGVQITQKTAAQLIPALGFASGAIINTLFIDHFQDMARGHFIVRRLERMHGKAVIKEYYEHLPKAQ